MPEKTIAVDVAHTEAVRQLENADRALRAGLQAATAERWDGTTISRLRADVNFVFDVLTRMKRRRQEHIYRQRRTVKE